MAPAEVRKKLIKKAGKLAKPMAQLGCTPSETELKTVKGYVFIYLFFTTFFEWLANNL